MVCTLNFLSQIDRIMLYVMLTISFVKHRHLHEIKTLYLISIAFCVIFSPPNSTKHDNSRSVKHLWTVTTIKRQCASYESVFCISLTLNHNYHGVAYILNHLVNSHALCFVEYNKNHTIKEYENKCIKNTNWKSNL